MVMGVLQTVRIVDSIVQIVQLNYQILISFLWSIIQLLCLSDLIRIFLVLIEFVSLLMQKQL